jgi:5-formyltetrahydrofolate cyclo-ligase
VSVKKSIRKRLLNQRRQLSSVAIANAEKKIFNKIKNHPFFLNSKCCALYYPIQNEIPTQKIIDFLCQHHVKVILPRMTDKGLIFYEYKEQYLIGNHLGIAEPNPDYCNEVPLLCCDLIVVPGVAFDRQGGRIGRGAGCYDRALAPLLTEEKKPRFIGLAYGFQQVDQCYAQAHDITMDEVITDGVDDGVI